MVNKIVAETVFSVLLYWLFAWTLANTADILLNVQFGLHLQDFLPHGLLVILSLVWTRYTAKTKKQRLTSTNWWFAPSEFAEDDEREKKITNASVFSSLLFCFFINLDQYRLRGCMEESQYTLGRVSTLNEEEKHACRCID